MIQVERWQLYSTRFLFYSCDCSTDIEQHADTLEMYFKEDMTQKIWEAWLHCRGGAIGTFQWFAPYTPYVMRRRNILKQHATSFVTMLTYTHCNAWSRFNSDSTRCGQPFSFSNTVRREREILFRVTLFTNTNERLWFRQMRRFNGSNQFDTQTPADWRFHSLTVATVTAAPITHREGDRPSILGGRTELL